MSEYIPHIEIEYAINGRQYEKIDPEDLAYIGFADGYADLESDEENIAKELNKRAIKEDKKGYFLWLYEEGYSTGTFMSENAALIYDEDGELKDEYDL